MLFPTICVTMHPINIKETYLFLGVLDLRLFMLTIYDSSWHSNYYSKPAPWFTVIQARNHKVSVTIQYWDTQPTDVIPAKSFTLTLMTTINKP